MRSKGNWQFALRLIVGILLASGIAMYAHLAQGYWLVIAVLIAIPLANTILIRKKIRFLFCIGIIIGALSTISGLLSNNAVLLSGLLFLMSFATVYLGASVAIGWRGAFVVNFFVILSGGIPMAMSDGVERFLCISGGFILAGVLYGIIFPCRLRQDVNNVFATCLETLAELSTIIFTCFLSKDYPEKYFYYEKKLHEIRSDYLYHLDQARTLLSNDKDENAQAMLSLIEQLFEVMLALNTLLYRISDHTTFDVVGKELLAIATVIENNLKTVMSGTVTSLVDDIQEMAEVNRSALQVVARDPVVFLLFMNDLENLNTLLIDLAERSVK